MVSRALPATKDVLQRQVFSCKYCNTVIDRDYNGARNILLKTLTELEHTLSGGYLASRVEGVNPFYVVA